MSILCQSIVQRFAIIVANPWKKWRNWLLKAQWSWRLSRAYMEISTRAFKPKSESEIKATCWQIKLGNNLGRKEIIWIILFRNKINFFWQSWACLHFRTQRFRSEGGCHIKSKRFGYHKKNSDENIEGYKFY